MSIDLNYYLKEKLGNDLGIRCVFPCSIDFDNRNGTLARCILEKDSSDKSDISFDKLQEDVIARCRPNLKLKINDIIVRVNEIFKESLNRLYVDVPIIDMLGDNVYNKAKEFLKPRIPSTARHPGLTSTFKFIETESDVIILQDYCKHTILSLSRFHAKTTLTSPTLGRAGGCGARDLRLRFIIYQLLQVVSFIHSNGIVLDNLIPADMSLDDNMWLTIPFGISERACVSSLVSILKERDVEYKINPICFKKVHRPIDFYVPLTLRWIEGRVSNFDYLMAINHAAGRTMVDPLYHPILPWISDFTCDPPSINHGYRDLSKTKFRLSKGDAQLETTYKHSDPRHHVPESLSELTYYIYMARRTPLQVLRRVVRDVFVPEHYPHSIARMYDWTPDECIPEFFFDENVFSSIHKDLGLPDLELPSFASTPKEFIAYHRNLFEEDYVSSNIHHWIDLTFGYCLEGTSAIRNMNVPLKQTLTASERLGDISNLDKHPGFIMLFNKPHPKKNVVKSKKNLVTNRPSEGSFNRQRSKSNISVASVTDKSLHNFSDLEAFVNLDNKYHMNNRIRRRQEKKLNSIDESAGNDNKLYINNTNHKHRQSSKNKQFSLSNGIEQDTTWHLMSLAEDVDISKITHEYNILNYTKNFKFSEEYSSFLDPTYSLANYDFSISEIQNKIQKNKSNFNKPSDTIIDSKDYFDKDIIHNVKCWDDVFINDLMKLLTNQNKKCADVVQILQSQDMFSVGCVIAEMYLGKPLLDNNTVNLLQSNDNTSLVISGLLHKIYDDSINDYNTINHIPLVMKRLIAVLLISSDNINPNPREVLQACTSTDYDMQSINTGNNLYSFCNSLGYVDFNMNNNDKSDDNNFLETSNILNLLDKHCSNVFPSYFYMVYKFIGDIKLANNGIKRLNILLSSLKDIIVIPLEGIGILLPHILTILSDSKPFRHIDGNNTTDENNSIADDKFEISDYATIIDIIGQRLGMDTTDKIIIPRVLEFLNNLKSPKNLQHLLVSTLWNVIIIRAGVKSFLKYFYPLLLTYLSSSILQNISIGSTCYQDTGGISPIWATMGISDRTEWLHLSDKTDLKQIQESTVLVISNLVDPGNLGIGLCARYVIPSLLCLIGVPQFSVAGFRSYSNEIKKEWCELREAIEYSSPQKLNEKISDIERYLNNQILNDTQDMYTVHALVGVCSQLNDIVISELILSKVFDEILPDLESLFKIPIPSPSTISALMEVMLLLNGILPNLTIDTITKYYLQPFKSNKSYCLPKLLCNLPLTVYWSVTDDIENNRKICDIDIYLESERRYSLLFEFIRLVVSTSMIVGPNLCVDYVLPSVDRFFQLFIDTFSSYPVESKAMQRAFELGAELYLSLENLTGQSFYTSVQSLNPRLQLWLNSVGSGMTPRKSPPLPSNILAEEAVVDVSQSNSEVEKKKKGMFNWISSSSSSKFRDTFIGMPFTMSSKSSSSHNITSKSNSTDIRYSNDATNLQERTTEFNNINSKIIETIDQQFSNSGELSPVSSNVFNNTNTTSKRRPSTMRTPFEKINKAIGNAITNDNELTFPSTEESLNSVTEGMELRTMETTNSINSSPVARTLNFSSTNEEDLNNFEGLNSNVTIEEKIESLSENPSKFKENLVSNDDIINKDEVFIQSTVDSSIMQNSSEIKPVTNEENYIEIEDENISPIQNSSIEVVSPVNIDSDTDEDLSSDELDEYLVTKNDIAEDPKLLQRIPADALLVRPSSLVKSLNHSRDLNQTSNSSNLKGSIPISIPNPSNFFRKLLSGQHSGSISTTLQNFRKIPLQTHNDTTNKFSKVSNMILSATNRRETESHIDDDVYYNDITWLLAGHSKWNYDQHQSSTNPSLNNSNANNTTTTNVTEKNYRVYKSTNSSTSSKTIQPPSAQISMTSPRITVDVAYELGALFTLGMNIFTQWKADESNSYYSNNINTNNNSNGNISNGNVKCLTVNSTESLLLSSSKAGTKLWSLNTNPVKHLATYPNSFHSIPFMSSFLRSGIQVLTCDGNITVWDIETSSVLNYLTCPGNVTGLGFTSVSVIPTKFGITPGVAPYGDDQIVTASMSTNSYIIGHYDFRLPSIMKAVSEWYLPQLPVFNSSTFTTQSTTIEQTYISALSSCDNYLYSGSNTGALYVVDRRMGKLLSYWQGHDSSVLKISSLNDYQFVSVAEKSANVWTFSESEAKKVYSIKNMPESTSTPLTTNTVLLSTYESNPGQNSLYQHPDMRSSFAPIRVLYGIAGHKMYGTRIKIYEDANNINQMNNNDFEDIRLVQTYFNDRNKQKIPKNKLSVTSAVFLPLRRLLLLGTEDGYIKVVS